MLDAALGDSSQRGDGDGDLIRGHGQWLAVKISAADDVAFAFFVYENQRIVGGAVQFDQRHFARLRKGIANCAVNLRSAAQAIGVLDARVFFRGAMRFADFAAFVQMRQVSGGTCRPGIRASMHNARIKCPWAATQRVERKCRCDVGSICKGVRVAQGQAQEGKHALRAIQEG